MATILLCFGAGWGETLSCVPFLGGGTRAAGAACPGGAGWGWCARARRGAGWRCSGALGACGAGAGAGPGEARWGGRSCCLSVCLSGAALRLSVGPPVLYALFCRVTRSLLSLPQISRERAAGGCGGCSSGGGGGGRRRQRTAAGRQGGQHLADKSSAASRAAGGAPGAGEQGFYLDVKQNAKGRFLKIAEVGAGGNKGRLTSPVGGRGVRDYLATSSEHYAQLGPSQPPERVSGAGEPQYYMDLKENQRGRFLPHAARPSSRGPAWAAPPGPDHRAAGAVAIEFREPWQVHRRLTAWRRAGRAAEGTSLTVDNQALHFRRGLQQYGVFIAGEQVSPTYVRTPSPVPYKVWAKFGHTFCNTRGEMKEDPGEQKAAGNFNPCLEQTDNFIWEQLLCCL
uniref:Purine rich element binding protein A n=1 Tax=Chelonoidis abingdonii TaxID=106734 RepID=A0A8C0J341_CHEAB